MQSMFHTAIHQSTEAGPLYCCPLVTLATHVAVAVITLQFPTSDRGSWRRVGLLRSHSQWGT